MRVLGSEEFASTRELRPFSRSTCWFLLTKGYREPLAKNPESGGTCSFCSSTGMVFKKAEEDCGEWPSGMTAYGHEPLLFPWGEWVLSRICSWSQGNAGEALLPSTSSCLRCGMDLGEVSVEGQQFYYDACVPGSMVRESRSSPGHSSYPNSRCFLSWWDCRLFYEPTFMEEGLVG